MATFEDLSFKQKLAHFEDVARRALPLWGIEHTASLTLLNFTENATYAVESPSLAEKIIMRVSRTDYTSKESVMSELAWMSALRRDTDLSIPAPIPLRDGSFVGLVETPELGEVRCVVCFTFAKGRAPVDSSDGNAEVGDLISAIEPIPDGITIPLFRSAAVILDKYERRNVQTKLSDADRQMYRTVGVIMAKMHVQSGQWQKPSYFTRMNWGFEGTFGEWNNFYGAKYNDPAWISPQDAMTLNMVVDQIYNRLRAYGKTPDRWGVIHSDLRAANLLQDGDVMTVLDFDDCGEGWYMYDIAGAVALMEHRADLFDIVAEIVAGYETVRPLSNEDKAEIPTFIMMRRLGMLQSLICRIGCVAGGSGEVAELTPEILAFYAKGTVVLGKRYLHLCTLNEEAEEESREARRILAQRQLTCA